MPQGSERAGDRAPLAARRGPLGGPTRRRGRARWTRGRGRRGGAQGGGAARARGAREGGRTALVAATDGPGARVVSTVARLPVAHCLAALLACRQRRALGLDGGVGPFRRNGGRAAGAGLLLRQGAGPRPCPVPDPRRPPPRGGARERRDLGADLNDDPRAADGPPDPTPGREEEVGGRRRNGPPLVVDQEMDLKRPPPAPSTSDSRQGQIKTNGRGKGNEPLVPESKRSSPLQRAGPSTGPLPHTEATESPLRKDRREHRKPPRRPETPQEKPVGPNSWTPAPFLKSFPSSDPFGVVTLNFLVE